MAEQVAALFTADDPVALVGHSMGGKISMLLALLHPALVERLVGVDMSPVDYCGQSDFAGYIDGMQALEIASSSTSAEADESLSAAATSTEVRRGGKAGDCTGRYRGSSVATKKKK